MDMLDRLAMMRQRVSEGWCKYIRWASYEDGKREPRFRALGGTNAREKGSYCLLGAGTEKAVENGPMPRIDGNQDCAIAAALGFRSPMAVADFNNAEHTTHAMVLALIDSRIATVLTDRATKQEGMLQ